MGLVAASVTPLGLLAAIVGGTLRSEYDATLPNVILIASFFLLLWLPFLGIDAALYFVARRRWRITLRRCLLGGALATLPVPMAIWMLGVRDSGSNLGVFVMGLIMTMTAGAACGLIFWLIAYAGAKPPPAPEEAF